MEINEKNGVPCTNADTVRLYQSIYQNAQLGMGSAAKLLSYCANDKLTEILTGQQRGYTAILRDAANSLALSGIRPVGLKAAEKIKTCLVIHCATANDCDHSHIAALMIMGTTKRCIVGAKQKRLYTCASDNSQALMERLLRFQDASCRTLREFL